MMVLNGAALSLVQKLMGHASIKTTAGYLSVRTEDEMEALNLL